MSGRPKSYHLTKEDIIRRALKQSLLVGGVLLSVGAATAGATGMASAASANTNGQQSIVDKIADKFGLKKAEVQKVFDDDRASHEIEHQQKAIDQLAQLVKDGKLTQAQADALKAKAAELKTQHQANREAMKDKTDAERKTAFDTDRASIKQWLSDNKIDEQYARFLFGGHGRGEAGEHARPGMMGDMMDSTPNQDN